MMTTRHPILALEDDATVQRLARMLRGQRTAAVLAGVYRDPTIQQIVAEQRHDPEASARAAYISGLVVAEVAIARRAA